MYKVLGICAGALFLAGCNATIQPTIAYPQPRVVYSPPIYAPLPPRRPNCFLVERRTPYGIRVERVCR